MPLLYRNTIGSSNHKGVSILDDQYRIYPCRLITFVLDAITDWNLHILNENIFLKSQKPRHTVLWAFNCLRFKVEKFTTIRRNMEESKGCQFLHIKLNIFKIQFLSIDNAICYSQTYL